jgi:hypothetical protein
MWQKHVLDLAKVLTGVGTHFLVQDNYTIYLGGNSPANVPLQFRKGSADMVFRIPRPLGIAFEEKMVEGEACCVAEEVIAGSNAEKAGVKVFIYRCEVDYCEYK